MPKPDIEVLDDGDDEAEALIEDLLATLETIRAGNVEDATETLRRLLDDQFDVGTATEDYASGTEQAVEQLLMLWRYCNMIPHG